MSLEREYGRYELVCDMCGEQYEFDSFDEAQDFMDSEGWKKQKINAHDWEHICGSCKEGD